jgi:hypothetical protein
MLGNTVKLPHVHSNVADVAVENLQFLNNIW